MAGSQNGRRSGYFQNLTSKPIVKINLTSLRHRWEETIRTDLVETDGSLRNRIY